MYNDSQFGGGLLHLVEVGKGYEFAVARLQ